MFSNVIIAVYYLLIIIQNVSLQQAQRHKHTFIVYVEPVADIASCYFHSVIISNYLYLGT